MKEVLDRFRGYNDDLQKVYENSRWYMSRNEDYKERVISNTSPLVLPQRYCTTNCSEETSRRFDRRRLLLDYGNNPKVQNIIRFINEKITINIDKNTLATNEVLMRIAISALYKICDPGLRWSQYYIPKDIIMEFHQNLIKNLKEVEEEMIQYNLPF